MGLSSYAAYRMQLQSGKGSKVTLCIVDIIFRICRRESTKCEAKRHFID